MHCTISLPLLVISSCALGLPIEAQTFQAVPAYANLVDGHVKLGLPFGTPGFRTQILVDAAHVATTGALLNGIRFRVDRSFAPVGTTQVPKVTVGLSQTSVAIGALSHNFENKVTGPVSLCFKGTVSLPVPSVGFAGAKPWNMV